MDLNDNAEIENDYVDIEDLLEKPKHSERAVKAVRNLADIYISQEQLFNKGNMLGQYKSTGFLKTYIDVYERALVGKAETSGSKRAEDFSWGYARLSEALVEKGVLHLIMNDGKIYRLRNLRMAETIAYMINGQKIKTLNEGIK